MKWNDVQERMIVRILYNDKRHTWVENLTFITYVKKRDGNKFFLEDLVCIGGGDIDTDWEIEIGKRYTRDYEVQEILHQMPVAPSPMDYLIENHPEYSL